MPEKERVWKPVVLGDRKAGWNWGGSGGRGVGAADQGARGRSRDANRGLRSRGGTPAPRLCTGVGLPATEARSDGLNSVTGCTLTSRSFRPTPLQGLPYSIYPSTQLPSCPLLQEASLGTPGGPDPRHTVVPHGVDLQTTPCPARCCPGSFSKQTHIQPPSRIQGPAQAPHRSQPTRVDGAAAEKQAAWSPALTQALPCWRDCGLGQVSTGFWKRGWAA